MRKVFLLALATLAVLVAALPGSVTPATTASQGSSQYVVLYKLSATKAAAHAAITAAGGTIVRENTRVGLATVRSSKSDFLAAVTSKAAIKGAAHSLRIGHVPKTFRQRGTSTSSPSRRATSPARARAQLLRALLRLSARSRWLVCSGTWEIINATADTSHAVQPGDPGVLVGIIDTGIDSSHPDIAPNFDASLSRNFTTDIPSIRSVTRSTARARTNRRLVLDPADVDEAGHGTHVAGTVAAAVNGLGIAGVAPKSPSSTSVRAKTRASSSCSPRSTRSRTRATMGSTSST